jgi:transcriptional regulator with XRE-family HTH domain
MSLFGTMKVSEIKPLLKAGNITQAELARHLGISRVHVTQLISGKRRMSVDTMNAIENFLAKRTGQRSGVAETPPAHFAHRRSLKFVSLEEAKALVGKPVQRLAAEERRLLWREAEQLAEAARRAPRVTDMSDDEMLGYDE